jgi:hypothetical protein
MASKNDLAVHSDKLRAVMGRDIRRYFLSALMAAFGTDVTECIQRSHTNCVQKGLGSILCSSKSAETRSGDSLAPQRRVPARGIALLADGVARTKTWVSSP